MLTDINLPLIYWCYLPFTKIEEEVLYRKKIKRIFIHAEISTELKIDWKYHLFLDSPITFMSNNLIMLMLVLGVIRLIGFKLLRKRYDHKNQIRLFHSWIQTHSIVLNQFEDTNFIKLTPSKNCSAEKYSLYVCT